MGPDGDLGVADDLQGAAESTFGQDHVSHEHDEQRDERHEVRAADWTGPEEAEDLHLLAGSTVGLEPAPHLVVESDDGHDQLTERQGGDGEEEALESCGREAHCDPDERRGHTHDGHAHEERPAVAG